MVIEMKNLYIDFDGVIVDTIPAIYDYLASHGLTLKDKDGYSKDRDLFNQVSALIAAYDFEKLLNEVDEINDAFKHIEQLTNSGKFKLHVLTHVNSLEEGIAKVNYIQTRLRGLTVIMVPKKLSKTQMVEPRNAILVDDYIGNLAEWEASGGHAILFNSELQEKGYPVINSLNTLMELY